LCWESCRIASRFLAAERARLVRRKGAFHPKLDELGLGWVNFQVLRRTNASLSRTTNIDDKVSADQRGHGLGVSLAVYAISGLDQKIEAVTKLESEVMKVHQRLNCSPEKYCESWGVIGVTA
jgi:hypothetical protein